MKKTYISPVTKTTIVQTTNMLALSLNNDSGKQATVTGGEVEMETREDAAWDIWGEGEY